MGTCSFCQNNEYEFYLGMRFEQHRNTLQYNFNNVWPDFLPHLWLLSYLFYNNVQRRLIAMKPNGSNFHRLLTNLSKRLLYLMAYLTLQCAHRLHSGLSLSSRVRTCVVRNHVRFSMKTISYLQLHYALAAWEAGCKGFRHITIFSVHTVTHFGRIISRCLNVCQLTLVDSFIAWFSVSFQESFSL